MNTRNLKGDKMIFSWKEIKTAFNEKVVNGTDAKEVTLGVLEVVGKSLVAGTTEIAKTAVNQVMDEFKGGGTGMASKVYDAMDTHEKKLNEIMNDPDSTQEQRSSAKAKLEELSKKKEEFVEKRKEQLEQAESKLLERRNDVEKSLENLYKRNERDNNDEGSPEDKERALRDELRDIEEKLRGINREREKIED